MCKYFEVLEREDVITLPDDLEGWSLFLYELYDMFEKILLKIDIIPYTSKRMINDIIIVYEKCIYFDCPSMKLVIEKYLSSCTYNDVINDGDFSQPWIDILKLASNKMVIVGAKLLKIANVIIKYGGNIDEYLKKPESSTFLMYCKDNKVDLTKILLPSLVNAIIYKNILPIGIGSNIYNTAIGSQAVPIGYQGNILL